MIYPDNCRMGDTDISIRPYYLDSDQAYQVGNVEMVCGFDSNWDEARLTFRVDKKPIMMDGRGATWDELKANPRFSWIEKKPYDVCNNCVTQLIKDKDVEFTFCGAGSPYIHYYYPVYCDICDQYFTDEKKGGCDSIVFYPSKTVYDLSSHNNNPYKKKPNPKYFPSIQIITHRSNSSNGWKLGRQILNVENLDLGNAKRHYGRVCDHCVTNIVLRELGRNVLKMKPEIQQEIIQAGTAFQNRPGGAIYHEAHENFTNLANTY